MNFWPFQRSRAARDASRLLGQVVAASRNPALFGEGKAADTLEGRFEVLTIFGALAMTRLQAAGDAGELAQHFADQLFRHLDAGLREAGVGDLAVPKRMHRLAGEFYGRTTAYASALQTKDETALAAALERNIGRLDHDFAAALARWLMGVASQQAAGPLELLFAPDVWRGAPE